MQGKNESSLIEGYERIMKARDLYSKPNIL